MGKWARVRPGEKRYIGDGAYVTWDGFAIELTTENGITTTNRIVLEPEPLVELERFVADIRAAVARFREQQRNFSL